MTTSLRTPRSAVPESVRRSRMWAVALAFGAVFMLGRAVQLVWEGALTVFVPWVGALLLVELLVNGVTVVATATWGLAPGVRSQRIALRAVSATVLVHAARVMVFVLGRTGPWVDFDVRPERRVEHADQWSWMGVWFAGSMAAISLLILGAVWWMLRGPTGQSVGGSD